MKKLSKHIKGLLTAVLMLSLIPNTAAAEPDRKEALDAMLRAAKFMVEEVSYNGGYVWTYAADLSRQWGEAPARKTQVWVQGGTLDMGNAFLDCWEATDDSYFLECAMKAANALVYGQHPLGGWHYFIEFDKPGLDQWYRDVFSNFKWGMEEYRHYYGNCTFDDDVTTGATRFLMRLYLATLDPAYKEPLDRALKFIRTAQYPNGAWPQRYPLHYEFAHDGLPDYTSFYTFNDGVIPNAIEVMVMAYELLGDERNMEAARRGMDFLIAAQGPEGQAAWADQHGMDLKPASGRTHEAAGYMPRYTVQAIRALQDAWLVTGDRRYLKPIPGALEWLEKSALATRPDGKLSVVDRYEYGTNRPILRTRSNRVNEEGYGIWEWSYGTTGRIRSVNLPALKKEYDRLAALSPQEARALHAEERQSMRYTPGTTDLEEVESLINSLDERGAWIEELPVYGMDITKPSPPGVKWDNQNPEIDDDHAADQIPGISTSRFRDHMRALANYVSQSNLIASCSQPGDPIKIMPVGNSITAGEHYRFPALEERTGYRKDLYEKLVSSGYDVDFVGSQSHGIRSEDEPDWYDWNNEAYPGWKIPDIARMVKISLKIYKPDILLVHVGTNGQDWKDKPGQLMEMLDMINEHSVANDHPMTVFLCLIINRFEGGDSLTTQFNKNVAGMISSRTGDRIKIRLVDMENGAGLDYSDHPPDPTANPPYEGGDMLGETYPGVDYDRYHPNDKGNTKMAEKFYEELVKELGAFSAPFQRSI